ncbi:AAA family ATPase [Maritimibacter sp. UBA3975]|uniref:AAA family ATPase n=1 Tax=Maritimibacter sp. UBA3975 TaxID=1946833 RepID=UPI000C0A5EA3|nr:AAA family ATPase [Maritimibacter sp. UBA3975]MAM62520.1 pilus assembly protein CpaE [Maritimibacter sp.]|tara:strand:+ start:7030 stop:8310 length:1281 start_codon:yes stop_codon:yes gene_type:complete
MSGSTAVLDQELAPIVACTISRDVQAFDLLIEDMESELGESWGDLSIADAIAFFQQPDSDSLEFIAIAMDDQDEANLAQIAEVIRQAAAKNIKAIVIAEEVSPIALHQLLKVGAEEFIPYPLPDGALHDAIERLRAPEPEVVPQAAAPNVPQPSGVDRQGVLIAVHGLAGGTGATTVAVNLAWELATITKEDAPRVCLIDLDLQFGSVSTYLDLPRREVIYEMLADMESADDESFMAALLTFNEHLHVFTAPSEMLPLDLISPADVAALISRARANFDYVIVDMPTAVVQWTETVLQAAHVYFATVELDMRSAQNTLRMIRALKSEDLPVEKLRYILNRAPKFTDLNGKSRVKRMAESLDIQIELLMPDGGKPIIQAGDHGVPLAEAALKNPLRKEIQKLAEQLHALSADEEEASGKKGKKKRARK